MSGASKKAEQWGSQLRSNETVATPWSKAGTSAFDLEKRHRPQAWEKERPQAQRSQVPPAERPSLRKRVHEKGRWGATAEGSPSNWLHKVEADDGWEHRFHKDADFKGTQPHRKPTMYRGSTQDQDAILKQGLRPDSPGSPCEGSLLLSEEPSSILKSMSDLKRENLQGNPCSRVTGAAILISKTPREVSKEQNRGTAWEHRFHLDDPAAFDGVHGHRKPTTYHGATHEQESILKSQLRPDDSAAPEMPPANGPSYFKSTSDLKKDRLHRECLSQSFLKRELRVGENPAPETGPTDGRSFFKSMSDLRKERIHDESLW